MYEGAQYEVTKDNEIIFRCSHWPSSCAKLSLTQMTCSVPCDFCQGKLTPEENRPERLLHV